MLQFLEKRRTSFSRKGIRAALAALLFFFSWYPVQAWSSSSPGKVLHLDIRGLEILLQSDPNLILVDVRTPEELAGPLGTISRSRNVPLQEIEKNPEQFPRDKTLVMICRTGHRSLKAADLLAEQGYIVYSVDGGMKAWREVRPVSTPSEGAKPQKPGKSGTELNTTRPQPPEKDDRKPPEKDFFDNKMGC